MARLFGFEIKRATDPAVDQPTQPALAPRINDDGALDVVAGGAYGTYIDLEGTIRSEADLVGKYRAMAMHPEVDSAITDIVNDMIIVDEQQEIVKVDCSKVGNDPNLNAMIEAEFNEVLELLSFSVQAHRLARQFYIDGRLYFQAITDIQMPEAGIQELRYLDPRKIRKIRELTNNNNPATAGVGGSESIPVVKQEYYVYNPKGFQANSAPSSVADSYSAAGIKIAKDSIVHVTSGLTDPDHKMSLSYLHQAIKPLNMLKSIEDAALIYRLTRAPSRRIFYVDIGNLPRQKADQYLMEMMTRYKNKVVYDAATGQIRDERKFTTMTEDFWIPRREGGRGTEIQELPGGQNTGVMEEMQYYKQNLYAALHVPFSRTNPEAAYSLGRATEISRDENKFSKFIDQLRGSFNELFLKVLERQLVLKNIIAADEWQMLKYRIKFIYSRDNMFNELKESEIMMDRLNRLNMIQPFIGTFWSAHWVRKNVLRQTDEEIAELNAEIAQEQAVADAMAFEQQMAAQDGDPNADPNDPNAGGPPANDNGDQPPQDDQQQQEDDPPPKGKKQDKKPAKDDKKKAKDK